MLRDPSTMPAVEGKTGHALDATRLDYGYDRDHNLADRLVFRRRLDSSRYTYSEIWRQGAETRAIALTAPLPFLTCGIFACVIGRWELHVANALRLAVAVWLIGPLPVILTDAAFIKLHRVFVTFYAAGWLVKLVIVALAASWFLR
jgi:hypothetical protein